MKTYKEKHSMVFPFIKDWKNSEYEPIKNMEQSLLLLEYPEASSIHGS